MVQTRVIASLTLIDQGVYRTQRFKKPTYIGDPVVAVKIFNEKEVDEMMIVDITPKRCWTDEKLELLEEIASEAFMPMAYGGNIGSVEQAACIFAMGYEKVAVNTAALTDLAVVEETVKTFGSQSVIGSLDAKKRMFKGYQVYGNLGRTRSSYSPVEQARRLVDAGVGEILVNSIDRDGSMTGYDLELVRSVVDAVGVPVVAMGGAGTVDDLVAGAKEGGASGVAAGSMFVFQGRQHRGVLINYPKPDQLREAFSGRI